MQLAAAVKRAERAHSREFDALVRSVGECKSKAEEDAILAAETAALKSRLKEGRLDGRAAKEALVRLLYVEMLGGRGAAWGHVRALQACSDANLAIKKAAYLASSLFLDHTSDLTILLVNTLARDLASDNVLVCAAALTAAARVVGPDTLTAVLPAVVALLAHPRELVRKKAVLALHAFIQLDPAGTGALPRDAALAHLRQALCDKDPSVMAASLPGLEALAAVDPALVRPLTPSLVSILKQVAAGRLPRAYDYHRVPAPFIQVRLLKLLALLGAGDALASSHMHAVVRDAMARGLAGGHAAGSAVAAECVVTAAAVAPDPALLDAATGVVSSFLASPSRNMRYVGVGCLAALVRGGAPVSDDAQLAVIDCLEDADDSLRGRTLDLLTLMATPANVDLIVDRMIDFIAAAPDDGQRAAVAASVRDLGERYAPSPAWFVATMDRVFEAGGDAVPPGLAHDVARLVADGGSGGADAAADAALRASAVDAFMKLLTTEGAAVSVPRLTAAAWVLGEYGGREGGATTADVASALAAAAARGGPAADPDARAVLVTALAKLAARSGGGASPATAAVLRDAARAKPVALAARAAEAAALLDAGGAAAAALAPGPVPVDVAAVVEAAVGAALAAGAAPYDPARAAAAAARARRRRRAGAGADARPVSAAGAGLRFEAYETPASPGAVAAPAAPAAEEDDVFAALGGTPVPAAAPAAAAAAAAAAAPATQSEPELTVRPAGGRRWGPAPVAAPSPRAAAAAAAPTAAPAPAAASPRPPSAASPSSADPARARLAASLFGASPAGGAAAAGGGLRRSPVKPAGGGAAAPTPAPAAVPVDDLLGGLAELAAPPLPASSGAPQPPPFGAASPASPLGGGVAPGLDLLSGGGGGGGDPFAASAPPPPPPGGSIAKPSGGRPATGDPFADLLG